jgi:hypothetical protein
MRIGVRELLQRALFQFRFHRRFWTGIAVEVYPQCFSIAARKSAIASAPGFTPAQNKKAVAKDFLICGNAAGFCGSAPEFRRFESYGVFTPFVSPRPKGTVSRIDHERHRSGN